MRERSLKLKSDDRFIVIATDGLWEVINPHACMRIVSELMEKYSLEEVCKMLYWISQQKGSYDNITIILADLSFSTVVSLKQPVSILCWEHALLCLR